MIGIHLLFVGLLVGTEAFFTTLSVLNIRHAEEKVASERAWLTDSMAVNDPDSILDYLRTNQGVGVLQSWVTLGFLLVVLYSGLYRTAARKVSTLGLDPILEGLVFILGALLAYVAMKLVFTIFRQFVVEESFGFNQATIVGFLRTQFIGITFTLLIFGVLTTGLLLAIEILPQLWWVAGVGLFAVVFVGSTVVQSRVVLPLMYDTSAIEDGELYEVITETFDAAGGTCDAVYAINTSKETSKLNAIVTGFGPSKRVYLFDTLVDALDETEIQSVVAHELGHWQNGHLWKKIGMNLLVNGIVLFALWALMQTAWVYAIFNLPQETYVGLLTAVLWVYPLQRLASPLSNWLSYRHEYEADAFAVSLTGDVDASLEAFRTLTDENLGNPFPHPWYAAFNLTHPPMPDRMRHVREQFEDSQQTPLSEREPPDSSTSGS